jgi:hypothetical protein
MRPDCIFVTSREDAGARFDRLKACGAVSLQDCRTLKAQRNAIRRVALLVVDDDKAQAVFPQMPGRFSQ